MGNVADKLFCGCGNQKHSQNLCNQINSEKIVLIVGCDSEFGQLFAEQSIVNGFTIIAAVFTDAGLEQMERSLEASPGVAVKVDSTEASDLQPIIDAVNIMVETTEKQLWAIVSNIYLNKDESPERAVSGHFSEINFLAPILLIFEFLPLLRQTTGRVITILSDSAIPPRGTSQSSRCVLEVFADAVDIVMIKPVVLQAPLALFFGNTWMKTYRENPKQSKNEHSWDEKHLETIKILKQAAIAEQEETLKAINAALISKSPELYYQTGKLAHDCFIPTSIKHQSQTVLTSSESKLSKVKENFFAGPQAPRA